MTETQIIILLDVIIALNVGIQAVWLYLWLQDRKENNNHKETIKELDKIAYSTYLITKNTNKFNPK